MKKIGSLTLRCLVVGLAYLTLSMLIGGLLTSLFGNLSMPPGNMQLLLATTFVWGLLFGLLVALVSPYLHASRTPLVFIWTCVLFFNMASVIIEGAFFAPRLMPFSMVPRMLLQFFLVSVFISIFCSYLFPTERTGAGNRRKAKRSLLSWFTRFSISVVSYLVFYLLFGFINYQLVTRPYYEANSNLAVPPISAIIIPEAIRAVLITLSVLPLLTRLHIGIKRQAVICGIILFVVGGILPLMMQLGNMPIVLIVASGVEIFFQNFCTGCVTAFALGFNLQKNTRVATPSLVDSHSSR